MFTNPLKNLKAFDIRETDTVADLGAGTGFYSIMAAQAAARGKVYAVEIAADLLQTIRNKAKDLKLDNIEFLRGDVEKSGGTKLQDGVLDKVIASNVFFQLSDKAAFIEETRRILRGNGQVLFIDWSADSPIPHKAGILRPEKARKMFEERGFVFERAIDAGDHHYGMILIKN